MKIVLIGYMGSGKSSVGMHLAHQLKIPFKDLDKEIEAFEKMPIHEIFSKKGEIYFRRKESKILQDVLSLDSDFVLATGGGTPCYANSMEYMALSEKTTTVYLKGSVSSLGERLFPEKEKRPLLSHLETKEELMEFVGIHLFERSHFYNQADLIISTDGKSPETIAKEIMRKLF